MPKPARPELTVAGIGQLRGSAAAEGPREPLGHALLVGQDRQDTDPEGQKDIPSHGETGTSSEPPPDQCSFTQVSSHFLQVLSGPSPTPLPAAEAGFPVELPVLGDNGAVPLHLPIPLGVAPNSFSKPLITWWLVVQSLHAPFYTWHSAQDSVFQS